MDPQVRVFMTKMSALADRVGMGGGGNDQELLVF